MNESTQDKENLIQNINLHTIVFTISDLLILIYITGKINSILLSLILY